MNTKKVFVGMSGGVDSSVSAALLKRAGYDVVGVFIKVWQPDWLECTWREDRLDAMRVAAKIGIPFTTLDLEKEYKKEVIDYMIAEYKSGRVPNPDVMCNLHVKFGAFFDWAVRKGADYVATGHYARVKNGELLTGLDQNKDQSYFLWTLSKKHLEKVIFPIGELEKTEVRKIAERLGLPNADKKDSQGLCFVGKIDFKEFLSHYVDTRLGNVLDESGKVIGTHPGSIFFTIGERHGFTLENKTPDQSKYYVIKKDVETNTITVSPNPTGMTDGKNKQIKINELNFGLNLPADLGKSENKTFRARVRYRGPLYEVRIIELADSTAIIGYSSDELVAVPGQSLVIYDGDRVLGGGIIVE